MRYITKKWLNKPYYKINTKYGDWYILNRYGHVLEYSNGLNKLNANRHDLNTWQIVRLLELTKNRNIKTSYTLEEAENIDRFTFKNGFPKFTLKDIDHGTYRISGNTNVHGITSFYKI